MWEDFDVFVDEEDYGTYPVACTYISLKVSNHYITQ